MTSLILIRSISIAGVVVAVRLLDRTHLTSFILAFGFSHYLLGWYYSIDNFRKVWDIRKARGHFLFLAGFGGIFSFFQMPPPVLMSPLHHSLSDIYLTQIPMKSHRSGGGHNRLLVIRIILNTAGHLIVLHNWSPLLQIVPLELLFSIFCLSALLFCLELLRARRFASSTEVRSVAVYEGILVLLVLFGNFEKTTLLHTILYHSIFWSIYPALGILKKNLSEFAKYLILTSGLTLSFVFFVEPFLSRTFYLSSFIFVGSFHIYLSFALSSLNPLWVVKFFNGEPPQPASLPASTGSSFGQA